jgi:hypothetical protein
MRRSLHRIQTKSLSSVAKRYRPVARILPPLAREAVSRFELTPPTEWLAGLTLEVLPIRYNYRAKLYSCKVIYYVKRYRPLSSNCPRATYPSDGPVGVPPLPASQQPWVSTVKRKLCRCFDVFVQDGEAFSLIIVLVFTTNANLLAGSIQRFRALLRRPSWPWLWLKSGTAKEIS